MEETPWTEEALRRVENAPAFVRPGILKLVPMRARALGQSLITSDFLTQIRNESMLRVTKSIKHFGFKELTSDAFDVARQKMQRHPHKLAVLGQIEDFLEQRTEKNADIMAKFARYFQLVPTTGLPWTPEALERLDRIPEFIRGMVRQAIESQAKHHREKVVTPQLFDRAIGTLRMPHANLQEWLDQNIGRGADKGSPTLSLPWDPEPLQRLQRLPIAVIRQRVARRVENFCRAQGSDRVTGEHFQQARWQLAE